MTTTLLALHGFTQNGAVLREILEPLIARLPQDVTVECPDGPNPCSERSVERMQQLFGGARLPAPHLCWFDASDDGRQYHGFESTKTQLAKLIEARAQRGDRVGLLGFSQGAIGGAALAALSAHGRFPRLDFVILVAGRVPRADEITPLLTEPLRIPSLHVWGERDPIALPYVQPVVELFDATSRQTVQWPGSHTVPSRGEGADAIVRFIVQHATSTDA